eukprot:RCo034477
MADFTAEAMSPEVSAVVLPSLWRSSASGYLTHHDVPQLLQRLVRDTIYNGPEDVLGFFTLWSLMQHGQPSLQQLPRAFFRGALDCLQRCDAWTPLTYFFLELVEQQPENFVEWSKAWFQHYEVVGAPFVAQGSPPPSPPPLQKRKAVPPAP